MLRSICALLLVLFAFTSWASVVDEEVSGEDLAIDTSREQEITTDASKGFTRSLEAKPIYIPCSTLVEGRKIKFEALKNNIVKLLRDISQQPSGSEHRVFVCPAESLRELRGYIDSFGPITFLEQAHSELMKVALGGFERLGEQCAVDILTLSNSLHQWASELESFSSAVAHAEEDCSQAWAHFLAFIERSSHLSTPEFRSENCIFVDEYRTCFDV